MPGARAVQEEMLALHVPPVQLTQGGSRGRIQGRKYCKGQGIFQGTRIFMGIGIIPPKYCFCVFRAAPARISDHR